MRDLIIVNLSKLTNFGVNLIIPSKLQECESLQFHRGLKSADFVITEKVGRGRKKFDLHRAALNVLIERETKETPKFDFLQPKY